jgi:uncharacterized membrane protein
MERMIYRPHVRHMELPGIRLVSLESPWLWLARGLTDLLRTWPVSLAFGVVFAALGYLLVNYAWTWPHLALSLTSGFLLVAPFLAIVFYDLSRQVDAGARPGVRHALTAWRDNAWSIGLYGALLMFLVIAWERLSAIVVGLFLVGNVPSVESFYGVLFSSSEHSTFLIAYGLFGLLFAVAVFALSVVSLPMMLDRSNTDIATALVTSLWVVRENPAAMLLWAGIIVVLIALGYLMAFIGLVLFFPLLGHATWRAYQDLVEAGTDRAV